MKSSRKLERDMWRVVWVLLPIAAFIFLLLVIQRRRGHRGLLPCVHRRPQATRRGAWRSSLQHRFGHDARGLLGGAGEQQAADLVLAREVLPRR